ncbi:MAG: hypothetical protein MR991_02655 [Clostridiales bacterium]|nr:hypothetical protein [Clostridiales bacterium]MDD7035569.1 hypothetical protein [Bacillota bacterium]MDY2919847.1 hypothetical protein [Lentihominibacter sp.]
MGNGIIGKIIYFWIFMIGVIIFGKIGGVMEDTKTAIMVLIAAALIYIVWNVARYKGKKKREEREAAANAVPKKGRKR